MKTAIYLVGLLALAPSLTWAKPSSDVIKSTIEAQARCGNFVRYDDQNLFLGFGWYRNGLEEPRQPIPARMHVAPFGGASEFDLNTNDAAIDLVSEGNRAFVLTYSSIEEWDLGSKERVGEYQTYFYSGAMKYKQHAQAMARYKNKIIIAHGRLGVSFFDMTSKRITNQFRLIESQLPLESVATSVTVQGNRAYVLMDNFSMVDPSHGKPPFRGVVVINLDSESVVSELNGIDPGADSIVSDSKSLIISFMGQPLWKYSLKDFSGAQMPASEQQVWKFPVEGHPTGSPTMDDQSYYTCFSKAPPAGHGGFYTKVPMVLNRAQLLLN